MASGTRNIPWSRKGPNMIGAVLMTVAIVNVASHHGGSNVPIVIAAMCFAGAIFCFYLGRLR